MVTGINRIAWLIAAAALFLMAGLGATDIISGLLGKPVPGAYEFTELLMVIMLFLGFASAQEMKSHIVVELVVERLPYALRLCCELLALVCTGSLFLLFAYFGWDALVHSVGVGEYASGLIAVPLWPTRLALAIGASLMLLQTIRDGLQVFYKLRRSQTQNVQE